VPPRLLLGGRGCLREQEREDFQRKQCLLHDDDPFGVYYWVSFLEGRREGEEQKQK
jgi:hypothetical protein